MIRVVGPSCHRENLQGLEVDLAVAPVVILEQGPDPRYKTFDGRQNEKAGVGIRAVEPVVGNGDKVGQQVGGEVLDHEVLEVQVFLVVGITRDLEVKPQLGVNLF